MTEIKDVETSLKIINNNVVVMQTAFIEWAHGAGAEKAMEWIYNALNAPGLIPSDEESYSKDAAQYFKHNYISPLPRHFEEHNND